MMMMMIINSVGSDTGYEALDSVDGYLDSLNVTALRAK